MPAGRSAYGHRDWAPMRPVIVPLAGQPSMSAEAWTRSDPVSLGRLGGGPWLRALMDEVLMGGGATIGSALDAGLSTC